MKKILFNRFISILLITAIFLTDKHCILGAINSFASELGSNSSNEDEMLPEEAETVDAKILGWNGGSSSSGNNKVVSAEFQMSSLFFSGSESRSIFYYTDDYFKNNASVYNEHLSTMSLSLAFSGVASHMESYIDKHSNIKDVLSKIGFENITPNSDFLHKPEKTTMGSIYANKHMYLKDNSGTVREYNTFVIAMRSAGYEEEWASNFQMGASGDHEGFAHSRDIVYDDFVTFYNEHKNDYGNLPVKIWIVGYSRGGGVANLLGGKVTDNAATFNTSKENIYCYTVGTPKGALKSAHTNPPLASYTNVHNIVNYADFIQFVAPESMGFGRYGIDHEVLSYKSDKVHDATKRSQIQAANAEYMKRYNKMLPFLNKIDPDIKLNVNNLDVYELTLITQNLQPMIYKQLNTEAFTDSSPESSYYQIAEYIDVLINKVLGEELLFSEYPGTDYANIKGRDRYYQKYEDLFKFLIVFYSNGGAYFDNAVAKIKENATKNLGSMLPLLFVLYGLPYYDGPVQDRTNFAVQPGDPPSLNAYDLMDPVYPVLFKDAFNDDDYNFLISRKKDISDLLIDFLILDSKSNYLSPKSLIGTFVKNGDPIAALHKQCLYLAHIQSEDSYFTTPPADTINCDGLKTVTFTDLNNSKVEVYDENDAKIAEYLIDANGYVISNENYNNEYAHVVKSYNPVGLEIRVPSDVKYRAIVTASDKTLGDIVYREVFVEDSKFYRKEINLQSPYLKDYEGLEIQFDKSTISRVLSCYNQDELNAKQRATYTLVDNNGTLLGYGYDNYSYSSKPKISKLVRLSGESIKGTTSGDFATFNKSAYEGQGNGYTNINITKDGVYARLDLLKDSKMAVYVQNTLDDGYRGLNAYNDYDATTKAATMQDFEDMMLYYIDKNNSASIRHILNVEDGVPLGIHAGMSAPDIEIATVSDAEPLTYENESKADVAQSESDANINSESETNIESESETLVETESETLVETESETESIAEGETEDATESSTEQETSSEIESQEDLFVDENLEVQTNEQIDDETTLAAEETEAAGEGSDVARSAAEETEAAGEGSDVARSAAEETESEAEETEAAESSEKDIEDETEAEAEETEIETEAETETDAKTEEETETTNESETKKGDLQSFSQTLDKLPSSDVETAEAETETESETETETETEVATEIEVEEETNEEPAEEVAETVEAVNSNLSGNGKYFVSVPNGIAKDESGNIKNYYSQGDTVKITITTQEEGKELSSVSIYNNRTYKETRTAKLNEEFELTVEDSNIRVLANYKNKRYPVNFVTQGDGAFYYYNGREYVLGKSGNSYEVGTKIKIVAPYTYDGRKFYGWTLKNTSGAYLNGKNVDTPLITDISTKSDSSYIIELKEYGLDILANYQFKTYTLKLNIASAKGSLDPSTTPLEFTKKEDFDSAKTNVTVASKAPYTFKGWREGSSTYAQLKDYNWQYNKNVTLTAEFEGSAPGPTPGPGGGGSGGGSGGGGGGGGSITDIPQISQNTVREYISHVVGESYYYVNQKLQGPGIFNELPQGSWTSNENQTQIRYVAYIANAAAAGGSVTIYEEGGRCYLSNGIYKIGAEGCYYMLDERGNLSTGFKTINNKVYYFDEKGPNYGAMVFGSKNINGIIYEFGQDGALINNPSAVTKVVAGYWQYSPALNKWNFYASQDGITAIKLTSGRFAIKGHDNTFKEYIFDSNGFLVE